ncbi:MAG TPA: hypothetical protein VGM34_01055, partial [Chlamydiales bacterium]
MDVSSDFSESTQQTPSPELAGFALKLQEFPTTEEKIAFGLSFMRSSISQEGAPRFREFWDARKTILPLFKTNINPVIRSKLWAECVELTVEARRLKEILEEQGAFAVEQIELALTGMEQDAAAVEKSVKEGPAFVLQTASTTISSKSAEYGPMQRELDLLNTLASRLNGLRKEVAQTEMRIRFKTKFFKRLSALGDAIFPKRKTLIDLVSQSFEKDVDGFIAIHFQGEQIVGAPYFVLREEIKALQSMAKVFTLSSGVFNRTRLKLSECWDKLKVVEKEHKKEILAQREASSESRSNVQKKIEELKERSPGLSLAALDLEINPILTEMREMKDLSRYDVKMLRDELDKLRAPHLAEQEIRAKALEEAEKEKFRQKRERIRIIKETISQLLQESTDVAVLEESFEALKKEVKELNLPKIDQQQIDRSLRQLKGLLADKKESSMLDVSEGDREALQSLKQILQQKKERRQEVKDQLEQHRRALGSSNLDFEKAMLYRELMEQEKELLVRANAGIEEIEQKIAELEG